MSGPGVTFFLMFQNAFEDTAKPFAQTQGLALTHRSIDHTFEPVMNWIQLPNWR